jgi:hypothetical protein
MAMDNQTDQHDFEELHTFLDYLPHKIKTEVALYVYHDRYKEIKFFKDIFQSKEESYIIWLCPLLKPNIFTDNEQIYSENDKIQNIFILTKGKAALVLPRFNSIPYVNFNEGDFFGMEDIIGSSSLQNIEFEDWYTQKILLKRMFNAHSITNSETLTLNLENIN